MAAYALVLLAFCLACAHGNTLNWSSDTLVEKEYQVQYCQGKPDKAHLCKESVSVSNLSSQAIVIDSIHFKIVTPEIQSAHALLYINHNTYLPFAFHKSIPQEKWPWRFSSYNEERIERMGLNPGEKEEFHRVEIDNCLFNCPIASGNPVRAKSPVTGLLIFSYQGRRDTIVVLGLQNTMSPAPAQGSLQEGRDGEDPNQNPGHGRAGHSVGPLHLSDGRRVSETPPTRVPMIQILYPSTTKH